MKKYLILFFAFAFSANAQFEELRNQMNSSMQQKPATPEQIKQYTVEACKIEKQEFTGEGICQSYCGQAIVWLARLRNVNTNTVFTRSICEKNKALLKKNVRWSCHLNAVVDCGKYPAKKVNTNNIETSEKVTDSGNKQSYKTDKVTDKVEVKKIQKTN